MAAAKNKNTKYQKRANKIRKIEEHLKKYHQYKISINNIQLQIDSIMPQMTATYELREGGAGAFVIKSDTENFAIDRIESTRALMLHEELRRYQLIIDCIDAAVDGLKEKEQEFVELRYFYGYNPKKVARAMGYSEANVFNIRNEVMAQLVHSLSGLETL
jgi:DNA-directed RNA polymerase specialized sigma subunit